jgi:hypothetical protein
LTAAPTDDIPPEKRGAPRAAFTGITFVRSAGQELTCIAGDLSETGISLFPPMGRRTPEAPTAPLQVTFALPATTDWVRVGGTVVRQARLDRRVVWGVRFEAVPAAVRAALRGYVQEHGDRTSTARGIVGLLEADEPPPLPPDLSPLPAPLPAPDRDRRQPPGRPTKPLRPVSRTAPPPTPTRELSDEEIHALVAPEVPTRRTELDTEEPTTPRPELLSAEEPTRPVDADVLALLSEICRDD